jgi:hypothetical protein
MCLMGESSLWIFIRPLIFGVGCLTSILNMNDEEISLSLTLEDLVECEIETNTIHVGTFVGTRSRSAGR